MARYRLSDEEERIHEAILDRMRNLTREEWIERLTWKPEGVYIVDEDEDPFFALSSELPQQPEPVPPLPERPEITPDLQIGSPSMAVHTEDHV